jgi:Transposase DDE domain
MIRNGLANLMKRLTDRTVLADLLDPAFDALGAVRSSVAEAPVLDMKRFLTLGVLRHLQGIATLREQVQGLLHLDPSADTRVPRARSIWSDALASPRRLQILTDTIPELVRHADTVLPDRLAGIPGLGTRPVYALDGTYEQPSAHFRHCPPCAGGDHNPKGHGLLTFHNLRLGVPVDVQVEVRNRHEITVLRDYDKTAHAVTQRRNALFVVDRAFIDAPFWDVKEAKLGITLITRMKSNLRIDSTEALEVSPDPVNAGDLRIMLSSSRQPWRLVTYRTRRGHCVEFLTNAFDLEPGVIAFLYSRRWEEEKCFDTWKNDFSQAKAWSKSSTAIENQARLAIVTSILIALVLQQTLGTEGSRDIKSLRRQVKAPHQPDGTDRPLWTAPVFRYTSKVSRQVLRFFKHCFLRPATPGLYQAELRPSLMAYL